MATENENLENNEAAGGMAVGALQEDGGARSRCCLPNRRSTALAVLCHWSP